jgi:hypothetical protein
MTNRERAGRLIYVASAKDVDSLGADGGVTRGMNDFSAAQPAGERRSCELFPEVGGREHDIVNHSCEHQLVVEYSIGCDPAGTPCHRESISDLFGHDKALGDRNYDFVQTTRPRRNCDKSRRICLKVQRATPAD